MWRHLDAISLLSCPSVAGKTSKCMRVAYRATYRLSNVTDDENGQICVAWLLVQTGNEHY
jgi:hypothetical protein